MTFPREEQDRPETGRAEVMERYRKALQRAGMKGGCRVSGGVLTRTATPD